MNGKLDDYLSFHSQALLLRSQRQQVLASNIANADTPNYKARDFDFAAALNAATAGTAGAGRAAPALQYRTGAQGSLDGNSVDLDAERAQFADNAVRYEAALRVLNQEIKTMLSAIQS